MSGVIKREFGYTGTALSVPQNMRYEAFCESVAAHEYMGESVNWWIGDLLVFGYDKFGEDKTLQAINATRKKPDTLSSYKWVAESIEPARRRQELSWSAHKEVAMLDPCEQDRMLQMAVDHHLSSREIRKMCKGELYIDDNGNVIESADRVPCEDSAPNEIPKDRKEAMIAEAKAELCPTILKLRAYLAVLGDNGEFDAVLDRMQQYGEMMG